MDHELLKAVIYDQHTVIRSAVIVPRTRYTFDPEANYVLVGLRRAGKSTLLHDRARKLVEQGAGWEQIVYIDFEDERLSDMTAADLNDILAVQCELSTSRGYFFFDEIQNVKGWEKFARRMADSGERVYITGSNAHMLSGEIASVLGGRYLEKRISPYSFEEYLTARGIGYGPEDRTSTKGRGYIAGAFAEYLQYGGLPEVLRYTAKRDYISSVYQKILLGDIVTRKKLRNDYAMKLLIRKIAETVMNETSFSNLYGSLKAAGVPVSKDTVIEYVGHAREAYLLFDIKDLFSKFSEREGTPKYYFSDTGLLDLFLVHKTNALLENAAAIWLTDRYPEGVYYLRSSRTGIDVDFYVPERGLAVQVCQSLSAEAYDREVGTLVRLASMMPEAKKLLIATLNERRTIEREGYTIEAVPLDLLMLDDTLLT